MIRRGRTLLFVAYTTCIIGAGSLGSTPYVSAATLRVDAVNGADVFGCGGDADPCASIQQAVNESNAGDTILVAEGTYTYESSLDPCFDYFTAVVCVRNTSLTILGGYSANDWSTSNPQTNSTVIDGDNTQRGVLVYTGTTPSSLVMEGFTVRRGLGVDTPNDINAWGGGVFAKVADLTLRDMVIEDCTAQGRVMQTNRGGTGAGGGIAVKGIASDRCTAIFENVTCDGNTARGGTGPERGGGGQGGGLWINYSDATGDQLVFTNNSAISGDSNGDGVFNGNAGAQGGGVAFKEESNSVFTNVTANGNVVSGGDANLSYGVAGFAFGGGLYGERATFWVAGAEVRDNNITGGDADTAGGSFGGGVYALDCDVNLERAVVIGNTSTGGDGTARKGTAGGGGCHFSDNDGADGGRLVTVSNSIIADNLTVLGGGGGEVGGGGSGVFLNGSTAKMTHCTIANNSLSESPPLEGTAVVIVTRTPTTTPVPASMVFDYGIISDHAQSPGDAAVHVKADSTITFNSGLFANNGIDVNGDGAVLGLVTMASVSSVGYVSPGAPGYDYHLGHGSAAVNAAIGSAQLYDVDGETRDFAPDIGADELEGVFFVLDVLKNGDGSGRVTSLPIGVDCGSSCSAYFEDDSFVNLVAEAAEGSRFEGFGGDADCADGMITVNDDVICTATFTRTALFADGFESGDASEWYSATP